ncbi:MAG: YceI family protein [Fibrobacterota bacterium]
MKYLCTLICIFPLIVWADSRTAVAVVEGGFNARATGHSFSGEFPTQAGDATLHLDDSTVSMALAVPLRNISTDNSRRDNNMYKMFAADTYEAITGEVTEVSLKTLRDSTTLPLSLTIRDITKGIDGTISDWKEEGGNISFTPSFTVSLDSFDLDPDSPVPGLRVREKVEVALSVHLDPS